MVRPTVIRNLMPKQGWAKRQIEKTTKNISEWPEWMRRAAVTKREESNANKSEKTSAKSKR